MKKIIILFMCCIMSAALFGQIMNQKPDCSKYKNKYKIFEGRYDAQGKKVCDCYKGMEVSMTNIKGVQVLQKQKAKGKGGGSDQYQGYQPLLFGYHMAYMDPLDPQANGTSPTNSSTPFYIFNDVQKSSGANPDLFHYMGGSNTNIPKFLDHKEDNKETYSEYITNSIDEMSSAFQHNMGASVGVGGFEIGGNYESAKRFTQSNDKMVGIHINKSSNGVFQLTSFASLSQEFLEALVQLQTGSKSQADFVKFMKIWGSHYAGSVKLGRSKYALTSYTAEEVFTAKSIGWDANIGTKREAEDAKKDKAGKEVEEAVTGYSATASYGQSNEQSKKLGKSVSQEHYQAAGQDNGSKSAIEVKLIPIYELCKAIKNTEYSNTLFNKFKAAHEKFFADLIDKDASKRFKPFISQESIDALQKKKDEIAAAAENAILPKFEEGDFDAVTYFHDYYYFFKDNRFFQRKQGSTTIEEMNAWDKFAQIDLILDKHKKIEGAFKSGLTINIIAGGRVWEIRDNKVINAHEDGISLQEKYGVPLSSIDYVVNGSSLYFFKDGKCYKGSKEYQIDKEWRGGQRISSAGDQCTAAVYNYNTKDYYFFRKTESLRKGQGEYIEKEKPIKGDWCN